MHTLLVLGTGYLVLCLILGTSEYWLDDNVHCYLRAKDGQTDAEGQNVLGTGCTGHNVLVLGTEAYDSALDTAAFWLNVH